MQNLKSVKRKLKSQASEAISEVVNDRGFEFKFGRRRCHFAHHDGAEYFSAPSARVETELPKLLDHIHTLIQQIASLDVDPLEFTDLFQNILAAKPRPLRRCAAFVLWSLRSEQLLVVWCILWTRFMETRILWAVRSVNGIIRLPIRQMPFKKTNRSPFRNRWDGEIAWINGSTMSSAALCLISAMKNQRI
jgi:hypothetical protein